MFRVAGTSGNDDDANAPNHQFTPHVVDEENAQCGVIAGREQHLDDGDDEEGVVLHPCRQGEGAQTGADAHAEHFGYQPCRRNAEQELQSARTYGLEGEGDAAERFIAGEHHVFHDAVEDQARVGYVHGQSHDGGVVVRGLTWLVPQVKPVAKKR